MKKYNIYLIFTLMPLSICAEPASELPPMVITSNIREHSHEDLQDKELPDLNGVLRQEPSITINQGSGQMTSNLSFRGALTSKLGNFSGIFGRSDVFSGISEAKNGIERDKYEMNHASGKWSKNFDKGKLDASLYFVKSKQDIDAPGLLPDKTFGWVDDMQGKLSDETWVTQLHGQYDLSSNWNTSLQLRVDARNA